MRLIIGTVTVFALLLAAALIGPSFVDWNKYKPQIITQVKKATGYDVKIDGDISMAVLPSPHVKVSDITITSPRKLKFDNLVTMKSAEVSVELAPLLSKKIVVDSVTLVKPVVNVEIMEDGTGSWVTKKITKADDTPAEVVEQVEANDAQTAAPQKAMDSVTLNQLTIEEGVLAFIDHRSKASYDVKDINIELEADSLKGPFEAEGSLVYQEKKMTLDVESGKLPTTNEPLKISADIEIPDAGSALTFNGLASIKAPFDVQGQTSFKTGSVQKMGALFGAGLPSAYNESLSIDGILTASESQITYNDLKFSFGNFVSNGKISITNFKEKNPVKVSGSLKSSSALDLNPFIKADSKKTTNSNQDLKEAGKPTAKKSGDIVPNSLTLPMPLDVDFKLDVGGLKIQNHEAKGVFVDVNKTGSKAKINFRALEVPGQAKADGTLNIAYASSSSSPKSGQVIYTDPSVTYKVNGQIGQLETFLKAFAPQADTKAITKLYKSAQFDLDGSVSNNAISLKDSTLKLDDMVIGLGGKYQPAVNGGKAKATVEVTAGAVDFDKITQTTSGKKATTTEGSGGGKKASPKEALAPVQNLSVPMDLTFDVSLQKARINNADLEGLRLTGSLIGNKLSLTNASVNNYAGAMMSVKGQVDDLKALSGIDLTAYTKTADVQRLAQAFKVDTSKLPTSLKALEASVSGKGSLDSLNFSSNLKAMGGQLDASGVAANPLDNLSLNNLTIGLKHPNLVSAIQIVSPNFKGATGLAQPVDFYSKAKLEGKTYTLTDMKTTLGSSNFGGNLTINTGAKIPSVRGNIQAGKIALDDLVGAKKSSGGSSTGGNSQSSGSSASSSAGRWSKAPIDLGWMNSVDVDVKLAATSITYGAWNFANPSTDLKIGNGAMTVNGLKAGVFGGNATLNTEVKAKPVSLTLSSDMSNINLDSLAKALSGSGKLKAAGSVSFNVDVNGAGESAHALINALNGKANLNGTDVTLIGFDLAKLARGLATDEKLAVSAMSLVDGAMSGGQTKFDTVKGDYKITNGLVVIQSMIMDSAEAKIDSTGSADLPKWFINVDNTITLKNVTDLDPFVVKIKGPIDNPSDTFGKNILQDYIQDKLRRKIGKELPNLLGDDVSDKLKKFGILPQDKTPTAAPTPATPAEGEAVPAPAAEPAPKKIEKPEDAINELLKGGSTEDAVNNVLKGLF